MGRGKNFTDAERAFIDAQKNAISLKDIANLLGRSYAPVWKYAHADCAWMSPIRVSDDERIRLRAMVDAGFCNVAIAQGLRRSVDGVHNQRKLLGIPAEKSGRKMTCPHCRIKLFTELQATFRKHGVRSLFELRRRRVSTV